MYTLRLRDFFNDNAITPPLKKDDGNGSVVEAGTTVVFTAPAGVDNRWAATEESCPILYTPDMTPREYQGRNYTRYGVLAWYARLTGTSFTPPDDAPRTGLMIFGNRDNAYMLYYDLSSEYVGWQRIINNTVTAIGDTGGNTGNPNVTPKRLALYWNPRGYQLATPQGLVLAANAIAAYYSDTDGASWTLLGSETCQLGAGSMGAGLFLKRSIAAPAAAATATYDFLEVYEQGIPDPLLFQSEQAAYEDQGGVRTAGGPAKHVTSPAYGVGQRVPGPTDQTLGSTGPFDVGAYEDGPMDLRTAGGPPQHQANVPLLHDEQTRIGVGVQVPGPNEQALRGRMGPDDQTGIEDVFEWTGQSQQDGGGVHHSGLLGTGVVVHGDNMDVDQGGATTRYKVAGMEDRLYYELAPDILYHENKNDLEGHAFLGDSDAYYITLYDTTGEPWASAQSSGNGFYGATRDGTLHYNGVPCAVGDFISGGAFNKTAWMFDSEEPLAADADVTNGLLTLTEVSGKLRLATVGSWSTWSGGDPLRSCSRWYLEGDFDIQMDFSNFALTGSDGGITLFVRRDYSTMSYVRRNVTGRYDRDRMINGSWGDYDYVATSHTSGKLRITRVGSVLHHYYWTGSAWAEISTGTSAWYSGRVWVAANFDGTGSFTGSVEISGFTVNSGTVSNKVGWAREGAGAHRSATVAFPTKVLLVSTLTSLDIIDYQTNTLWMRFVQAENNVIDNWGTPTLRPVKPVMKDGVLLLALSNDAGEGGDVWINFNLDWIRIHRADVSAITGADRKKPTGSTNWGIHAAEGDIIFRNNNYDWANDHTNWQIPDYTVYHPALMHYGGYEYRAHGTREGVAIHKWKRWWLMGSAAPDHVNLPQHAESNELTNIYWCGFRPTNRELMYMDNEHLYGVLEATYQNRLTGAFGGKWSADTSRSIPGTFWFQTQHVAVPYDTSYFFVPRNEGIYRINWPISAFSLFYGPSGSGATHEILPSGIYKHITLANDGTYDILVISVYDPAKNEAFLYAVNLVTNSFYGQSRVIRLNSDLGEIAA